jgi:hypothetical protein
MGLMAVTAWKLRRVEHRGRGVADGDPRLCAGAGARGVARTGLKQQLGDGGRFQHETEAQRRLLRGGLEELPGDGQVDGGDQILPGPVLVDPVAQCEVFGALRDDREHRAGHGGLRWVRPVDLRDQYAVDGGRPVGAGMPGQQRA